MPSTIDCATRIRSNWSAVLYDGDVCLGGGIIDSAA
jgi:tRNA U34 2-thiouridine synthase MnmA/TrmU